MTAWSWVYMLTVWGLLIALNAFCFIRMFRAKENGK